MTAPALILLAEGSNEPGVTDVAHTLRKRLQMMRPELSVNLAFLDHCPPTGPQVVSTLAHRQVDEMVFVPLDPTRAIEPSPQAQSMVTKVRNHHPRLNVTLSRPIGPASDLLNVLDLRLRHALTCAHAIELDGLVLLVPHGGDVRGNALLSRRSRQWATHHKLPCQLAYADGSGPSLVSAISSLREQGRRHIAVGSLFMASSEIYRAQVELALAHDAIVVSPPLGCDPRIMDLAIARYAFAAMDLLDFAEAANPLHAVN